MDRPTLLMIAVVVGVSFGLGGAAWLAVLLSRTLRTSAERQLQAILDGVGPHDAGDGGSAVDVLCYAYYGFVASLTTVTIRCRLPLDRAHALLDRVHRFNLRWGCFAAAGAFVPIASTFRRWQQRRSFRKQLKAQEQAR